MAEGESERSGDRIERGTNPISQLNLQVQSYVDISMKEIEGAQSTKNSIRAPAADKKESEAIKEKTEAAGTEQDEPSECHAKQDMLGITPGGEAEGIVQSSAAECSESNKSFEDGGVKSLPKIVLRSRVRSLATSLEEDFKLKVRCQVEGEMEIEDAEILFAPSSRRTRAEVNTSP